MKTAVSSITDKTDRHYITEISLKVALNTITLTHKRNKSIALTCSTLLIYRNEVKNMMDKMKSKKYHTVAKSKRKITGRNKIDTPNNSLSWLGTVNKKWRG